MRKVGEMLFHFPWYPLLVNTYAVLALFAYNISDVNHNVVWRPLIIVLVVTIVFLVFGRFWLDDWERPAFMVGILGILFFSYGHVVTWLGARNIRTSLAIGLVYLALVGIGLWATAHPPIHMGQLTGPFNFTALILLLFPLATIVPSFFSGGPSSRSNDHVSGSADSSAPINQTLPDIYYIILDSYTRADLLKEAYGYDNSQFILDLEHMGFYIAPCSQSNYSRTELSLGSSLNMEYLQNLNPQFVPGNIDRAPLWEILKHGAVRRILEGAGYRTVAFATGFPWSQLDDADVYLEPSPLWNQLTEFEALLIDTTAGRAIEDLGLINLDEAAGARYRERTLFVLNKFDDLAHMKGPKFVFIHIIPPHPPFVFGPDGEYIDPKLFLNADDKYTPSAYSDGYQRQLTFINGQIESAVERLIANSSTPPVIVIQGDHGPWLQPHDKRFRILNAYFLPGHRDSLYPSVSPVNTFRILLNSYFGGHYKLLKDISYDSPVPHIYNFSPVPYLCAGQ
jgi:hypothetical protein